MAEYFKFYQWETVTIPITIKPTGILEEYKDIVISFEQKDETLIAKHLKDLEVDGDVITVNLSQEETSVFEVGKVAVQFNILYEDKERDTSGTAVIQCAKNQYKRVMT